MSLIKWKSDVDPSYDSDHDASAALKLILSRDSGKITPWEGEVKLIKTGTSPGHEEKLTRVQVRKIICGVNILIDIGPKDFMAYHYGSKMKDSNISISSNGKMNFTLDEITEFNLVIREAVSVYNNLDIEE